MDSRESTQIGDQEHTPRPSQGTASRTNPIANYQFSPDELRVLRECNSESFFKRSLPIGTSLGLGVFFGVKNGLIKGHVKWGATPKVMLAVTIGYFIGKFSYQRTCAEKLMRLPNSKLAAMLKQRRKGGLNESLSLDPGFGAGMSLPPFSSTPESFSDVLPGRNRSLDIDTERPLQKELNDSFRPSVDVEKTLVYDDETLTPSQTQTSYEELRRKNRDDYQKNKTQSYRGVMGEDDVPTVVRAREVPVLQPKSKQNKYGDSLE